MTPTYRTTRTALALAAAMTLGVGCSIGENVEKTEGAIDETAERTEGLETGEVIAEREPAGIAESESLYLGLDERENAREVPEALKRDFAVKETFDSVIAIAEHVSLTTGIPVNVSPDAISDLAFDELEDELESGNQGAGGNENNGALGLGGAQAPNVPGLDGESNQIKFEADYEGDLAGFLDAVSARYSVDWRYREGRVNFYRYGTETFTIETLPGIANGSTSMDGQSGGESSSTLSASFNSDNLDVWAELRNTVDTMLSEDGEVTISPSIGKLTVTDIPANLRRVGDYVEDQNRSLAKSVAVEITVLNVSLEEGENYGIDWSVVTDSIASNVSGAINTGTGAADVDGDTFSLSVDPDSGAGLSGSEAIVDALSTQGDVSVVTRGSVTTLNNRPAPLRSGRSVTYLAEREREDGDDGEDSVSVTPGTFRTGFSAKVLPHILPDNEILLEYGVDLRSLIELAQIEDGNGGFIQAPDIAVDEFVQQTRVKSGETMVTGGFLQERSSVDREGVGAASNVLAGNTASEQIQDRLFIIVEPVLQD